MRSPVHALCVLFVLVCAVVGALLHFWAVLEIMTAHGTGAGLAALLLPIVSHVWGALVRFGEALPLLGMEVAQGVVLLLWLGVTVVAFVLARATAPGPGGEGS